MFGGHAISRRGREREGEGNAQAKARHGVYWFWTKTIDFFFSVCPEREHQKQPFDDDAAAEIHEYVGMEYSPLSFSLHVTDDDIHSFLSRWVVRGFHLIFFYL